MLMHHKPISQMTLEIVCLEKVNTGIIFIAFLKNDSQSDVFEIFNHKQLIIKF